MTPCPACAADAIYSGSEDRYFHADGTDNRPCWAVILRGDTGQQCISCKHKITSGYLIRGWHLICTACMHRSSKTPALHRLVAPDCPAHWHDVWDHGGDRQRGVWVYVSGTIGQLLEYRQQVTR